MSDHFNAMPLLADMQSEIQALAGFLSTRQISIENHVICRRDGQAEGFMVYS
jgi:hypothetical protein